jgi:beta-mannosidase
LRSKPASHDSNALALTIDSRRNVRTATSRRNSDLQLNAGINHVSFPIRIVSPKLWYPVGYGAQNRYRFSARFASVKKLRRTPRRKTGLRSVELRRVPDQWGKSFEFVVNGISVFAKGADVIPFDSFPNRVTPEIHRKILEAARDAHMNMVREWGGGILRVR